MADSEVLPTIFDPRTCVRKGLCPVTQIRNKGDPFESHSLYFEQHGTGPLKVIFIMGLNSSSFSWLAQVEHFKHFPDKYSILVFDNRGVGNSGSPRGPYTTTGMAEDVITLMDYVGWSGLRQLHIVGLSLGGMIAQELALLIPERIVSLTLGVTTPGGYPWQNFPPWHGFSSLARLTFISDLSIKIPIILEMVYTLSWLDEKAEDDPLGRTNREVETETLRQRIGCARPQTLLGSLSQMCAALTHRVTSDRLREISASIPKVALVTGDLDHLVSPEGTQRIKQAMPEAEVVIYPNTGHAVHVQRKKQFNALLERVIQEGVERASTDLKTKTT